MKLAIQYYETLKKEKPSILNKLTTKFDMKKSYSLWKAKVGKIYLPQPRAEDFVIPQDDTYLTLKEIDLTKYKNQKNLEQFIVIIIQNKLMPFKLRSKQIYC